MLEQEWLRDQYILSMAQNKLTAYEQKFTLIEVVPHEHTGLGPQRWIQVPFAQIALEEARIDRFQVAVLEEEDHATQNGECHIVVENK